jgi:hypothetical protein
MGDKNITLFALHTHGDNQFGPSSMPGEDTEESGDASSGASLFGSEPSGTDGSPGSGAPAEEESGGGALVGLVVALVVLAGIAMAVKKLKGGGETDVDVTESDQL